MLATLVDHMDCAHHLVGHGKCERPHGHTYRVEVCVEVDPEREKEGFFDEIQRHVDEVFEDWDHYDLNLKLKFPSCEHIAQGLFHEFRERLPNLVSIRAWEGKNKWSEIHRDDAEASQKPVPAP